MKKIRLGVNIDHVATVRNARGEKYPSPLRAAMLAQKIGADSVTIHLREDRRHINEKDLIDIRSKLKVPLNLEIAATREMIRIALKQKPPFICIVPEKRKEITTEGGLNLDFNKKFLKETVKRLKNNGSRVSLFIEPKLSDIKKAKELNSDCIEIHTGKICNYINKNKSFLKEFKRIKNAVDFANSLNLEVHAGHGMTFSSAKILKKIKNIKEFNIGHFIVSSQFLGFGPTIKKFLKILK